MRGPMSRIFKVCVCLVLLSLSLSCTGDPIQRRDKHMKRADKYFDGQEFKKAIIEYRNVIQADPKYAPGHYRLALAYLKTAQPQKAFSEFSRAVDLDPDNLDAQLKLGQFYLLGKKTKEAADKADLAIAKEPKNLEALFLKMGVLLQQKKPEDAVETAKKITAIDPNNIKAVLALAHIAARLKRLDEAKQYLLRAEAIRPDDPGVQLEIVAFLENQGDIKHAEGRLLKAINKHPANAALLSRLAGFYLRRGNLQSAEAAYLEIAENAPDKIEPKITIGSFYAAQRLWPQAVTWMKKALELQPENIKIKNALAAFYLDSGNPKEAGRLVDEILGKNKVSLPARLVKARILLQDKQWTKASEILEGLVMDQPDYPGAQRYLGIVYLAQHNAKKAKGALLKAVAFHQEDIKARVVLARIFLSERSPDLALEQVDAVLQGHPEHYEAQILKANAFVQKQDLQTARQVFTKAAQMRSDDPVIYYQLALIDRYEHRYDKANTHLDQALECEADYVPALAAKVSLFMTRSQPQQALAFLETKIAASKDNATLASVLYQMQGSVLFAQKKYAKSEASFDTALALNPDLVAPYLSMARLYMVQNKIPKAIRQYQQILEKRPRFIQAHMALGAIYDALGETNQAEHAYEKALEIKPDFAPAANNLAWLLLQQKREPDRAFTLARQAKSQLPDDPGVADTVGLAYLEKGLYPSAISEFRDAAQKLPQNATIHYHLGLAYWKNQEKLHALEALEKALDVKASFPERHDAEALLKQIRAS